MIALVAALADPNWQVEIEAIAVVPLTNEAQSETWHGDTAAVLGTAPDSG